MKELYELYRRCGCKVSTDSRTIRGGELFFALRGENFDGNAYAPGALDAGAAAAVVNSDADLPDDGRLIKVEDPFRTLQELAIFHRENVLGPGRRLPVVGLTGTNGKTTTKELITAVLSKKYKVCSTKGNLNNDIGVPLSLLSIAPDTEVAVIEMGASHPDDIAKLVQVSRPDYGLITNVGKAHLLGFGSFEGVKAAKGEMYKYVGSKSDGLLFVNADDPDLLQMASAYSCARKYYGIRHQNVEILPTDGQNPFLRMAVDGVEIRTNLVGAYNADNVLAAVAVGAHFGVSLPDAAEAIAAYVPSNNRSQMMKTAANTLIVDAYNANPSSMAAALDNFARIKAGRKVAFLGDMRELGDDSVREHVAVVERIVSLGLEACLVGVEFAKALDESGINVSGWFATSEQLAAYLKDCPLKGATVLVKGSRGIQMEKIIDTL